MSKDTKVTEVLERGTVDVIVKKDLQEKLASGKKLRVKLGIDPTGFDLHLGHMVVVRKLKQLQDLGHHVILLFGNFTGQIGDPTGKMEARQAKTQKDLEKNAEKYLEQVSSVLDVDNVEVVWNADWLSKLSFSDVINLASKFSVAQMLERDMFQKRMEKNLPISMHEFFYPLMQGYDSVAIEADLELGGTDQTFNLLAGRTLQKAYGQEPQNIMTVPILEGLDGHIKMGKSERNYIGVAEDPANMYGKTMSIPDNLITKYFTLATDVSGEDIEKMEAAMKEGENPRNFKMQLARELVTMYHSKEAGDQAEKEFIEIFRNKGLPEEIPVFKAKKEKMGILDLIVESGIFTSKGEARRIVTGGGVKINDEKITDINHEVTVTSEPFILKVGKRNFREVSL